MFQHFDEDGNFIIESGSNAVPVFKVSGSQVVVSGSLLPGDPESSASAELGNEDHPWKELYVESASIWFVDTKLAKDDAKRKTRFSKKDIEDLKEGRSLNTSGHISASGDMHVVGDSLFRGETVADGRIRLKGETQVTGALNVVGAADFRGHFRVNGQRIEEGEFNVLAGLTATTAELNKIDGFTGVVADLNYAKDLRATGVSATEFNKLDGYTGDHNDLNYAKDLRATGVTSTEFNTLDGVGSTALSTQLGAKADVNNPRFTGAVAIGGVQAANQELTLTGDMSMSGALNVDGNMTVDGNSTMNGGWRMTNAIYYNAEPTDLIPQIGQTEVLADARTQNHFQVRGTNVDLIGIRGTEMTGQIITINVENARRMVIHHAENGGVSDIILPLGRDATIRGPQAVQFIYSRRFERWHRLV